MVVARGNGERGSYKVQEVKYRVKEDALTLVVDTVQYTSVMYYRVEHLKPIQFS